ncbi:MAG: SRPBCC family protein, partial [Solirubrobacterales bacterium]
EPARPGPRRSGLLRGHGQVQPGEGPAQLVVELDPDRGAAGSRGEVREIVVEYVPGSLVASDGEDESTTARQAVTFAAAPGGTTVRIELDYELRRRGPFTALTDLLFVRRAQADSLRRTLAGLDLAVTAEQP